MKKFRNLLNVKDKLSLPSSRSLRRVFYTFFFIFIVGVIGFGYASVLGFKFNIPLIYSGPVDPNDFFISIPFETDLQVANDLLQKIEGATSVLRLEPSTFEFIEWFPAPANAENNFPIIPGEGYIVRIPSGTSTNLEILGRHDPAIFYDLYVGNKIFLISIPYHTKWKKAQDIYQSHPDIVSVVRVNPHTNVMDIWFPSPGTPPSDNFPIKLGEAYYVRALVPIQFRPEHF